MSSDTPIPSSPPISMQGNSPTLALPESEPSPLAFELSPTHNEGFQPAEPCASPTRGIPQETWPEEGFEGPACGAESGFAPPRSTKKTPRRLVLDRGETGCSKSVAELVVHFSPKPAATPKPTPKSCMTPKKHAKSLFWEEIAAQEAEKALASPSKSPVRSSPLKAYPALGSPGSRGGSASLIGSPGPREMSGLPLGSPGPKGSALGPASPNPLAGAIWAVREMAKSPLLGGPKVDSPANPSPVKSSPFLVTNSLASPIFPKSPGASPNPRASLQTLHSHMPPAQGLKQTPKSPVAEQAGPQSSGKAGVNTLAQAYPNPVIPLCAMDDCLMSGTPCATPTVVGLPQSAHTQPHLNTGHAACHDMPKTLPDLGAVNMDVSAAEKVHSLEEGHGLMSEDSEPALRMSPLPPPRVPNTPQRPSLERRQELLHAAGPCGAQTQDAAAMSPAVAKATLPDCAKPLGHPSSDGRAEQGGAAEQGLDKRSNGEERAENGGTAEEEGAGPVPTSGIPCRAREEGEDMGVGNGTAGGTAIEGAQKGGPDIVVSQAPLGGLRAPSRLKRPTASSGFFGPGRRTSRLSISTAKCVLPYMQLPALGVIVNLICRAKCSLLYMHLVSFLICISMAVCGIFLHAAGVWLMCNAGLK
jgi:hypothetical protein